MKKKKRVSLCFNKGLVSFTFLTHVDLVIKRAKNIRLERVKCRKLTAFGINHTTYESDGVLGYTNYKIYSKEDLGAHNEFKVSL